MSAEFKNKLSEIILSQDEEKYEEFDNYVRTNKPLLKALNSIQNDERRMVEKFLSRFEIFNKSQQNTKVIITLAVKCFPKTFMKTHVEMIEMINFQWMQRVLVYFYNDHKDEMFNYYDNRMKQRFKQVKQKAY